MALGIASGLQRVADEKSFASSVQQREDGNLAFPVCPYECLAGCSSEALRQDCVITMAGRVLQDFKAGSDYGMQVWIRDTNTFIEEALEAGMDPEDAKQALLQFLRYQSKDGGIVDLVNLRTDSTSKNTVETDQETSLVQAIYKYIKYTNDTAVLSEEIEGKDDGESRSVLDRLQKAFDFLLTERYSSRYHLLFGATTVDWGDVQFGQSADSGILMDAGSNPSVDIYDNAMMVLALFSLAELCSLAGDSEKAVKWSDNAEEWKRRTRSALWDDERQKWRPHVFFEDAKELGDYKSGSPFYSYNQVNEQSFDEDEIYYHGGTSVAILAGLNTKEESQAAYYKMKENAQKAGRGNGLTVGLAAYPPYPNGTIFRRDGTPMLPYMYQNAGDWPWFGARTVQALIKMELVDEARDALEPMIKRTLRDQGFYEWYDQDNQPQGASEFHGAAGELAKAIRMLRAAEKTPP